MSLRNKGWGKSLEALSNAASGACFCLADWLGAPPRICMAADRGLSRTGAWLGRGALRLLTALTLGLAGVCCSRAGDAAPSEAQMKAAFLLNFPKYVDWPSVSFAQTNSPMVIAVFGDDIVADELDAMCQHKTIDGHPIQLIRVTKVEQCRDCQILFLGSEKCRKCGELLSQFQGRDILTVGESAEFIEQGGMINLARHERRIALEVSMDPIRRTHLKVSSKLLALATVEGGKK